MGTKLGVQMYNRRRKGMTMSLAPILITCLAFGVAQSASADPFSLSSNAFAGSAPLSCTATGTVSAGCSISGDVPSVMGGTATVLGTALAESNFGTLIADAEFITFRGVAPRASFFASADASFSDTLTLGGQTGTGFIQYHVSGIWDAATAGPSLETLQLNGTDVVTLVSSATPFPVDFTSVLYPIVFGNPFSLSASLLSVTEGDASGGDASGHSDLTASFDRIAVFDSLGNPISNYTLTTASGTSFVPEPGSVWLLLPVSLGCAKLAKRRRSNSSSLS